MEGLGILYSCYRCGRTNVLLASVAHAAGICFMCNNCIEKEELETKTVAVFGPHGIEFVSPEKAKELTNES